MEVFLVESAENITEYPSDPPTLLIIGVAAVVILAAPIVYTKLKRR